MALVGTATETPARWWYQGQRKCQYFDVDETSYTASGTAPVASNFKGFNRIDEVIPQGLSDNGHSWRWTGSLIRAFKADTSEGTATFTATDGSAIVTENFGNVAGGEFGNQVVGGTAAVGGEDVHAFAAADGAIVNTAITAPDFPRNLVIQITSAGGGALPAAMGNVVVNGTDQFDAALAETISLAALNSVTLGAGEEVFIVGTKTFKTVTDYDGSVDISATLADAQMSVGIGTKFGLAKTLDPATEAAILRVFKNNTAVAAATYVGDGTNNALDLGADLADNDDIIVQYTTDSDAAGGSITTAGTAKVDVEASGSDDVGSCLCLVVGI